MTQTHEGIKLAVEALEEAAPWLVGCRADKCLDKVHEALTTLKKLLEGESPLLPKCQACAFELAETVVYPSAEHTCNQAPLPAEGGMTEERFQELELQFAPGSDTSVYAHQLEKAGRECLREIKRLSSLSRPKAEGGIEEADKDGMTKRCMLCGELTASAVSHMPYRHARKCPVYPGNMKVEQVAQAIAMYPVNPKYLSSLSRQDDKVTREEAIEEFRMDELDAVMMSIDKWFDEDDEHLKLNPATRAAHAREIALKAIEAQALKLSDKEGG